MKKIVGIIAAVAMAASVFAIDIAGGMGVDGSLFDMPIADGAKPSAMTVNLGSGGFWWGSRLQAAFYGDKCGAQLSLSYHGWEGDDKGPSGNHPTYMLHDQKVWIQPVDMFKISFMNAGDKLNEAFSEQWKVIDVGGDWQFDLTPAEGITATLVLGNTWVNAGAIGTTGFTFKYAADFGTIGVMYVGNNTFKDGKIGAGYSGTFDPISMFVDVAFGYGANKGIAADFQIKAAIDALTIQAYAQFANKGLDFAKANDELKLLFKLDYALDGATPYLFVKAPNLLADTFDMTIKAGAAFNIGAAGCDVAAQYEIAAKKLSIPFSVSVGF